ncbi:wax ester/triacylglycerol synthase family O-acyltransferase [Mycolicibacterium smegmatis]|uniref:WS/DGAT/MGAT family O-acyltransferase n=1 Tax=Mycolicibacterium smegmatis TaxID=1772 RepID=UPI001E436CC9|nr:wax ester/triacylglycerol synthase family O-acyltransferase [Mycolicibacterium smegmatis]UGU34093.1 wax ester/triacylglycerol synthase family O-acyltransferase [Mycolicibacterium smegmatis]ULN68934.1 wax ester/triacylglycerol synthase family O-acyltransferase [Mycolicibacterium smegmatis]
MTAPEQLSVLDAGFLEAEDSDPNVSLAIGAVAVMAGPMPDFETLKATLAERILSVPRLRQVLHTRPLDLGAPEWVDEPHLDITRHIRRAALPRPGDDAALHDWVAEVMERRLDRDHPLWQCWVADGLPANRWTILIKIHHCVADGVAAAHLLTRLCDDGPEPAVPHATPPAAPRPSLFSLNPVEWVTGAWRTAMDVTGIAGKVLHGAGEIVSGLLTPAPSSLTGPVTARRRFAAAEVSLADVARVCERFDVTVNDVALAAITASFRSMLIARGVAPGPNALPTLVPVSVRPPTGAGNDRANQVSVMLPNLPVDQADPVAQLQAVHTRLSKAKASGQRQAGSALVTMAAAAPFPLTAWAVRALTRLPQRGVAMLATNVPGPRRRVTILGREVIRLLPVPPIALRMRTAVAILSYADHLAFGIISDYDAEVDVDAVAAGIEQAVARLAQIAVAHIRSTPLGTLALVPGGLA